MSAPAATPGRAGEHDAADPRIGLELAQGTVQLADQLRIQRIERLRPVEGDQRDALLDVDEQGFECHFSV